MPDKNIDLVPLKNVDIPEFKQKIQLAFQRGYEAEFGQNEKQVLPEKDIDRSLNGKGAHAYKAMQNGDMIGGAVVSIENKTGINHLDLLFVKCGCQSKGIGQAIWRAIEAQYPETKVWKTCTPYFEKCNIHFYVNCCGFHIVEFFNPLHKEKRRIDESLEGMCDEASSYFFVFEKAMNRVAE